MDCAELSRRCLNALAPQAREFQAGEALYEAANLRGTPIESYWMTAYECTQMLLGSRPANVSPLYVRAGEFVLGNRVVTADALSLLIGVDVWARMIPETSRQAERVRLEGLEHWQPEMMGLAEGAVDLDKLMLGHSLAVLRTDPEPSTSMDMAPAPENGGPAYGRS